MKPIEYEEMHPTEKNDNSEKLESVDKEFRWFGFKEKIETTDEAKERLEKLDIGTINLEGMLEKHQRKVVEAVETMMEEYPELKGYIGSIRTEELPEGVYACAGPKMGKDGFYAELQLSEEHFAKGNLEWKLVDTELENFRGERWLAGSGIDGIVKHEMAHLMHLRMISENIELAPGDIDRKKFDLLEEKYYHNAEVIDLCNKARENLGISYNDVARELSVYGSRDFGEFFAEAISEHETQKKPRQLANEVYRLYKERQNEQTERGDEKI